MKALPHLIERHHLITDLLHQKSSATRTRFHNTLPGSHQIRKTFRTAAAKLADECTPPLSGLRSTVGTAIMSNAEHCVKHAGEAVEIRLIYIAAIARSLDALHAVPASKEQARSPSIDGRLHNVDLVIVKVEHNPAPKPDRLQRSSS